MVWQTDCLVALRYSHFSPALDSMATVSWAHLNSGRLDSLNRLLGLRSRRSLEEPRFQSSVDQFMQVEVACNWTALTVGTPLPILTC
ncbi:unnamed protein product [Mesocestoides corti]|uniref:Secreted protein n=1 Tax=Mesocestoides corti TaxID=53468 RepID=A0A0R3UKK6_MESCO|nr:unnamed protein product [Mesocestoides corti]